MKKLLLVCFACTLLVSLVAVAQSTKQDDPATQDTAKTNAQDKQAEKPAQGTKTVTGCLQKGDEAGEFSIEGEDGKLWGDADLVIWSGDPFEPLSRPQLILIEGKPQPLTSRQIELRDRYWCKVMDSVRNGRRAVMDEAVALDEQANALAESSDK